METKQEQTKAKKKKKEIRQDDRVRNMGRGQLATRSGIRQTDAKRLSTGKLKKKAKRRR